MKLAWIGLGRIGFEMAVRLVDARYDLTIWDVDKTARDRAIAAGARGSDSPRAATSGVDAAIICLPRLAAVEEVVFGAEGIAANRAAPLMIIDHTTLSPTETRELARRFSYSSDHFWIDMPVTGGIEAARSGKLIAWAGGPAEAVEKAVEPAMSYCQLIHRAGDSGQGQMIKAFNQMIVGTTIAAWSEMLKLAHTAGLDPVKIVNMLQGGGADSRLRQIFAERLAEGDFPSQSKANFTKDLTAAAQIAEEFGNTLPLTSAALANIRAIQTKG